MKEECEKADCRSLIYVTFQLIVSFCFVLGKSKRASALVAAVEKATENFIERGEQIAYENPDITQEMLAAVEEVRKTGLAMSTAAREFSEDPCSSLKRGNMVRAARNLLSAVTRLLILADMVDVHLLLKSLHVVEDDLDKLRDASSQDELMSNMRQFGRNANELIKQAAKRQQELKDPQLRDDLAAARAILKKHSTMLLTASKVYVRHPELDLAKINRDYVLKQVCEAVNTISDVAQGKASAPHDNFTGAGELAAALDDFDEGIIMDPSAYNEMRSRQLLEERLESIISAAALMADADCTRDERRERIVAECNAVRQALQDLLSEYMSNVSRCKDCLFTLFYLKLCCRWERKIVDPNWSAPSGKCIGRQKIFVVSCAKQLSIMFLIPSWKQTCLC